MVQNHDMKTWVKKALASSLSGTTSQSTNIGSGIVPTGMKRFITYIRVNKQDADESACHIHIAEVSTGNPTMASAVAATNMKYLVGFPGGAASSGLSEIEIGEPGSMQPILSIAGGKFAGVAASGAATVDMVAQYYDE